MKAFVDKYSDPSETTDHDVVKLMHKRVEAAEVKAMGCDSAYMVDLAVLTCMLNDFWAMKGVDYESLIK